jgi:hypothetical protein
MDLLLDIKTVIAAYDQEVWFILYKYDQEFHNYAVTDHAIRRFIELFTVKTAEPNSTEYQLLGKLHRCDLPAVICADGYQAWYQRDRLHRCDLPAVIHADGTQCWYQRDLCHRCDLPAAIYMDGTQAWYQHGQRMPAP